MNDPAAEPSGFTRLDPPGFEAPLWTNPGDETSAPLIDAAVAAIRHNPSRILELNPGPGYRAVALARAFPDATILSLATDLTAARLAFLNTLAYPNLHFAILGRHGADGLLRRLAERGWDNYDTTIITAAPHVPTLGPWPDSVRLVAIQDLARSDAAAYPTDSFVPRTAAGYHLFYRLVSADLQPPPPHPLFDPATPHPTPAAFTTHCPGARTLRTRLRAGPTPVHLTIHFHPETEPETLLAEDTILAHETLDLDTEIPPWFGPCRIGFQTDTAAGLEILDAVLA